MLALLALLFCTTSTKSERRSRLKRGVLSRQVLSFTCFTGTKEQILTQFLRRRAGDDDEVARYIPHAGGDPRSHRGSKASKAVVKLVKQ